MRQGAPQGAAQGASKRAARSPRAVAFSPQPAGRRREAVSAVLAPTGSSGRPCWLPVTRSWPPESKRPAGFPAGRWLAQ